MPRGYQGRPNLHAEDRFLWTAFWELGSDRRLGFNGEGRIPSMAIRAYAETFGIWEYGDLRWFTGVIRTLDSEYLELRRPKDKNGPQREVKMSDHRGIRELIHSAAATRPRDPGEPADIGLTGRETTFLAWSRDISERY